MAFRWTDADTYPYRDGDVFLGVSDTGHEVGISTEKGLITIASARTGKGAALIIPNLLRWKQSAVTVDPKGEAAEETAERRAAMGQLVGVIDPYHEAKNIPDELRASINPLDLIDAASPKARLQLEALGDGMIRRFDPKHGQWDNKAAAFLAGFAAHTMSAPPEFRTLKTLRAMMMQPQAALEKLAGEMIEAGGIGGLSRAAGLSILEKFSNKDGVAAGGFENALDQTAWIDDEPFNETLGGPRRFDMRSLKAGNGSLYLVLHPDDLKDRGGFLRLFARMAMSSMTTSRTGGKCLFILDEFYSLGKMENILSAAGALPGYGIHLWPFLQDLGQLRGLYGDDGATSFFANSDAHIFFGNADPQTLDHVSARLGTITPADLPPPPRAIIDVERISNLDIVKLNEKSRSASAASGKIDHSKSMFESICETHWKQIETSKRNYDQMASQMIGKPRFPPDGVRELVARKDGDEVARRMIVFAKGQDVLNLRLAPFFRPPPAPLPKPAATETAAAPAPEAAPAAKLPPRKVNKRALHGFGLVITGLVVFPALLGPWTTDRSVVTEGQISAAILAAFALIPWLLWFRVWRRTPSGITEIDG